MIRLVASLIVRNERGRYLPEVIGHLRDFCDLIAVVDDGSGDGTAEWFRDNTDDRMVVKYIPEDDGFFAGHEGRRRQLLLDFTLAQQPSHVLSIDADEFVSDGDAIRRYCETPRQVGTLMMEEVWKADARRLHIRMDGGWRPHPVPILWAASLSGYRGRPLRIADRALACGREPEIVRRYAARSRPTGATVYHFGWCRESERQGRYERYVTADGGKFHANSHLQSILLPDDQITLQQQTWPRGLQPWKDLIVEWSQ